MNRTAVAAALVTLFTIGHVLRAAPPDPIEAQVSEAVARMEAGDSEGGGAKLKAIAAELEAALAKDAKDARRQFLLGRCRFFLGDDAAAMAAYDRALALAPDEPEYHLMKGVLLGYQKDAAGSIKEIATAAKLRPKESKYWYELGMAHAGAQERPAALKAFRKAAEVDPSNAKALTMAAAMLLDGSDLPAEAIDLLKRAAAADPKYVLARYNLGQVYQNKGDAAESLKWFREASKLNPADDRARAKLIQNLQALGKVKERDAERAELFKLHAAGKVEAPTYCREQFSQGKEKVIVLEYYELEGEQAVRYAFQVLDESGQKSKYRISLGSYEMTTEIAREAGEIGKDQRMFHLDAYYPSGEHRTYGMFKSEPTYEQARQMVADILQGKLPAKSASVPGGK